MYDYELDLIAQKMSFEDYALNNEDVIKEVEKSITDLPQKLKEYTEKAQRLVKNDMENKSLEL